VVQGSRLGITSVMHTYIELFLHTNIHTLIHSYRQMWRKEADLASLQSSSTHIYLALMFSRRLHTRARALSLTRARTHTYTENEDICRNVLNICTRTRTCAFAFSHPLSLLRAHKRCVHTLRRSRLDPPPFYYCSNAQGVSAFFLRHAIFTRD
jgi:hypothetical protein